MSDFGSELEKLMTFGGGGPFNPEGMEALIKSAGKLHRAALKEVRNGQKNPLAFIKEQVAWLKSHGLFSAQEASAINSIATLMMDGGRDAEAISLAKRMDKGHLARLVASIVVDSLGNAATPKMQKVGKGAPQPARPEMDDLTGALIGARLGYPFLQLVVIGAIAGAVLGSV